MAAIFFLVKMPWGYRRVFGVVLMTPLRDMERLDLLHVATPVAVYLALPQDAHGVWHSGVICKIIGLFIYYFKLYFCNS
jgi:hypothetical protein